MSVKLQLGSKYDINDENVLWESWQHADSSKTCVEMQCWGLVDTQTQRMLTVNTQAQTMLLLKCLIASLIVNIETFSFRQMSGLSTGGRSRSQMSGLSNGARSRSQHHVRWAPMVTGHGHGGHQGLMGPSDTLSGIKHRLLITSWGLIYYRK